MDQAVEASTKSCSTVDLVESVQEEAGGEPSCIDEQVREGGQGPATRGVDAKDVAVLRAVGLDDADCEIGDQLLALQAQAGASGYREG